MENLIQPKSSFDYAMCRMVMSPRYSIRLVLNRADRGSAGGNPSAHSWDNSSSKKMAVRGIPSGRITPRYMPSQLSGSATNPSESDQFQVAQGAERIRLPFPCLSTAMMPPMPPFLNRSSTTCCVATSRGSSRYCMRCAIVEAAFRRM